MQPQITCAVAWRFTQHNVPELVPAADFPRLAVLSARAEQACPSGRRISLGRNGEEPRP